MPINSFLYPGAKVTSAYDVANSCMFDGNSSQSLTRTFGTPTNNRIWTYSFWMKHIDNQGVFLNTGADTSYMYFRGSSANPVPFGFSVEQYVSSFQYKLIPNEVFRDHSAWQHIVIAFDTTQSTASNRVKIYKNGSQITSFNSEDYPSQNLDTQVNSAVAHKIGGFASSGFYDGYLAEVVFIDGQQLAPTSFGEFDEDSPNIWKPIDVSGLTFGNNGFYLDFEDSSALGNDKSGNDNDFTANNLSATNQSEDTCTNNYAIMNPALPLFSSDFRNGAVEWRTTTNSQYYWANSTIGVSQGKWYIEAKLQTAADHNYFGISADQPDDNTTFLAGGGGAGGANDLYEWGWKSSDGKIYNNTDGGTSYGSTYTSGDILGMYLDLDNNKLYFAKNGTIQNSGTGISITDPASTPNGVYFIAVGDGTSSNSCIWEVGFGNPSYGVSSANTDPNGYGTFEYSPNDGGSSSFDSAAKNFYALNTKNLAEFG